MNRGSPWSMSYKELRDALLDFIIVYGIDDGDIGTAKAPMSDEDEDWYNDACDCMTVMHEDRE